MGRPWGYDAASLPWHPASPFQHRKHPWTACSPPASTAQAVAEAHFCRSLGHWDLVESSCSASAATLPGPWPHDSVASCEGNIKIHPRLSVHLLLSCCMSAHALVDHLKNNLTILRVNLEILSLLHLLLSHCILRQLRVIGRYGFHEGLHTSAGMPGRVNVSWLPQDVIPFWSLPSLPCLSFWPTEFNKVARSHRQFLALLGITNMYQ